MAPVRLTRSVFINKDDMDLIMSLLDHHITCSGKWSSMFTRLQEACKNKRFTIEVENTYEVVPPGYVLERPVVHRKRAGYKRRKCPPGGSGTPKDA